MLLPSPRAQAARLLSPGTRAISVTCFAQESAAGVMLCDFQASPLGGFAASMFALLEANHYVKKVRLDY